MAQFRETIKGQRGAASRLGNKRTGLTVTANGWETGVRVELSHDDGRDVVRVYKTAGSIGGASDQYIAAWSMDDPAHPTFPTICAG